MHRSFIISEEERKRILGIHESATKRQYLKPKTFLNEDNPYRTIQVYEDDFAEMTQAHEDKFPECIKGNDFSKPKVDRNNGNIPYYEITHQILDKETGDFEQSVVIYYSDYTRTYKDKNDTPDKALKNIGTTEDPEYLFKWSCDDPEIRKGFTSPEEKQQAADQVELEEKIRLLTTGRIALSKKRKSQGVLVGLIQELLIYLKFMNENQKTKVYDDATVAAVRAFQDDYGVRPIDGVVGKDTWYELNKYYPGYLSQKEYIRTHPNGDEEEKDETENKSSVSSGDKNVNIDGSSNLTTDKTTVAQTDGKTLPDNTSQVKGSEDVTKTNTIKTKPKPKSSELEAF